MQRVLRVLVEGEYQPEHRRVWAEWGRMVSGAIVEVEVSYGHWVPCRVERYASGVLRVAPLRDLGPRSR